jgi:hypothetical protein
MPSDHDEPIVPQQAAAVAKRYRRIERPISFAAVLPVGIAAGVAYVTFTLVPAMLVALVATVAVRIPVFQTSGRVTLATDAPPEAVRREFESACPLGLAFQWGIADEIERTEEGWAYDISSLFGRRSVRMTVEPRWDEGEDEDLALVVTAGGHSWATYHVTVAERADGTIVETAQTSDRRFGLRRLPQWFVARRYRDEALAAQGYRVVDRETGLSL